MFISQVIFESEKENEEMIRNIMKKKTQDAEIAKDIISYEIWWKENATTVGFALVTKWNTKDSFQSWLKESHSGNKHAHHKSNDQSISNIKKTIYQFESVV